MPGEEPKIFIDEDWKSQVQREKEEAARKASAGDAPEPADAEAPEGPPEATFLALVLNLATEAMYSLGAVAQPGQQQVYVDLDQARYTLDMLEVLREKTKGNLNPEESGQMETVLSDLNQVFAMRVQQFQQQAMQAAGIDPKGLKTP